MFLLFWGNAYIPLSSPWEQSKILTLDSQELRVEMALEWLSPAATREYARCRQITYIAWIQADGSPQIEAVKG